MEKLLKQHRTPWDLVERARRQQCDFFSRHPTFELHEPPETGTRCENIIYLQGCWLVDPMVATYEDARHFMWAGLRALHTEARIRGLSDEQVSRLINEAFGVFHDAATSIFQTLKIVRTIPPRQLALVSIDSPKSFMVPRYYSSELASTDRCVYVPACLPNDEIECKAPIGEQPAANVESDLFVACEEDRPVPVTVRFKKLAPLLDPDAEMLASFKP